MEQEMTRRRKNEVQKRTRRMKVEENYKEEENKK